MLLKMTEQAQKIWETFKAELIVEPTDDMREALATAIRTLAETEDIVPVSIGPCDETYGRWDKIGTISQQDYNYKKALAIKNSQVSTYRKIHSIADELDKMDTLETDH